LSIGLIHKMNQMRKLCQRYVFCWCSLFPSTWLMGPCKSRAENNLRQSFVPITGCAYSVRFCTCEYADTHSIPKIQADFYGKNRNNTGIKVIFVSIDQFGVITF
jgi:hypothetical protein